MLHFVPVKPSPHLDSSRQDAFFDQTSCVSQAPGKGIHGAWNGGKAHSNKVAVVLLQQIYGKRTTQDGVALRD